MPRGAAARAVREDQPRDPFVRFSGAAMSVAAIVPAAGRGERLGPGTPKALRLLGGAPLLVHAVRALAGSVQVGLVVVAAPPHDVLDVRRLLADHEIGASVVVVAGGESRTESVALALAALPPEVDVVLVHDAARPLVPVALVDAVVAAVHAGAEAVVPGVAVADTVRQVAPDGRALATLDRSVLRAVQTPQGFRRELLVAAHAAHAAGSGAGPTDDAGLVELLGCEVLVVPGSPEAFKVTTPIDLVLAEAVLASRGVGGLLR